MCALHLCVCVHDFVAFPLNCVCVCLRVCWSSCILSSRQCANWSRHPPLGFIGFICCCVVNVIGLLERDDSCDRGHVTMAIFIYLNVYIWAFRFFSALCCWWPGETLSSVIGEESDEHRPWSCSHRSRVPGPWRLSRSVLILLLLLVIARGCRFVVQFAVVLCQWCTMMTGGIHFVEFLGKCVMECDAALWRGVGCGVLVRVDWVGGWAGGTMEDWRYQRQEECKECDMELDWQWYRGIQKYEEDGQIVEI